MLKPPSHHHSHQHGCQIHPNLTFPPWTSPFRCYLGFKHTSRCIFAIDPVPASERPPKVLPDGTTSGSLKRCLLRSPGVKIQNPLVNRILPLSVRLAEDSNFKTSLPLCNVSFRSAITAPSYLSLPQYDCFCGTHKDSITIVPPVANQRTKLPSLVRNGQVIVFAFKACSCTGHVTIILYRPCSAGQLIFPSSSSVTSPLPETVTALSFVSPASTFRLRRMTFRGWRIIIDDLYHIAGGFLSLFGKGGGGVGVPEVFSSAAFSPRSPAPQQALRQAWRPPAGPRRHTGRTRSPDRRSFGLLRLLRVGGLLLSLLLLGLLLLVLRGQQLQRAGSWACSSVSPDFSTSEAFSPDFSASEVFSPDFSASEVFSPDFSASEVFSSSAFEAFGGLGIVAGVVAGDDDVITVVLALLDSHTAHRDGRLAAIWTHRDFHIALYSHHRCKQPRPGQQLPTLPCSGPGRQLPSASYFP